MFDLDIATLIKKLLGSQIRSILVFLAGILVAHGVISPEQVGGIVDANAQIAVGVVVYLITFVWNYSKNLKVQKVEDLAKRIAPLATARIIKPNAQS